MLTIERTAQGLFLEGELMRADFRTPGLLTYPKGLVHRLLNELEDAVESGRHVFGEFSDGYRMPSGDHTVHLNEVSHELTDVWYRDDILYARVKVHETIKEGARLVRSIPNRHELTVGTRMRWDGVRFGVRLVGGETDGVVHEDAELIAVLVVA